MRTPITHEQALELLPWFVNGTLTDAEQTQVDQHVRHCLPCRVALQEQRHLQRLLQEQATVPLSAEPGFKQLLRQIDDTRPKQPARPRRASSRAEAFFGLISRHAATAAVLVVGLGIASWLATVPTKPRDGAFVTLTSESGASAEIDVVFADGVSQSQRRELLLEIDGVVTEDNSAVGRVRIRIATDGRAGTIDDVLTALRTDERIRFAARAFAAENAQ